VTFYSPLREEFHWENYLFTKANGLEKITPYVSAGSFNNAYYQMGTITREVFEMQKKYVGSKPRKLPLVSQCIFRRGFCIYKYVAV
jgi:hypothetical protein